jgi:hypothetical protein
MLTRCYTAREATRVQGVNDVVIFSIAGAGSFLSGYIYEWDGWRVLVKVTRGHLLSRSRSPRLGRCTSS